jgi:hypothetical protein
VLLGGASLSRKYDKEPHSCKGGGGMLFIVAGGLIFSAFALGLLMYKLHGLTRLLLQSVIVIAFGVLFWQIFPDKMVALFYTHCVSLGFVLADFPSTLANKHKQT